MKYGYPDRRGVSDRLNFGGIHRVGIISRLTKLRMELIGYDKNSNKITDTNGRIALIAQDDKEAATWSYASLLKHWNRKHNQACYVQSLLSTYPLFSIAGTSNGRKRMQPDLNGLLSKKIERRYWYGNIIILGIRTDFILFLKQLAEGTIVYDPRIKLVNVSFKQKVKRRSQFRIVSKNINSLYYNQEIVNISDA
ncbi:MAG: hypothetical protein IIB45_04160 [Candidatus Marinimicrobia bacterium]|nr:hypothetical protein [Candidatus Neomarinimicrobiota bacterium]